MPATNGLRFANLTNGVNYLSWCIVSGIRLLGLYSEVTEFLRRLRIHFFSLQISKLIDGRALIYTNLAELGALMRALNLRDLISKRVDIAQKPRYSDSSHAVNDLLNYFRRLHNVLISLQTVS